MTAQIRIRAPLVRLAVVLGLIAIGIFLFDLLVPLGVAAGVPYLVLVLLSLRSGRPSWVYSAASVGSLLVMAGLAFSQETDELWMALTNRGLTLFAIWATTWLCLHQQVLTTGRARAKAELDLMTQRHADEEMAHERTGQQAGDLAILAKQLEEVRAEAQHSTQAKCAFLAMMSHEIRTPMNGVVGMTDLLLETELTPTQRDYAEIVRQSADALLAIIDDILDFSKIEAGRFSLEPREFDLRTTVDDVVVLLAQRADAKDLKVAAFIDPRLPATLNGDQGRIRQVLVNLIGNAIKFTVRGQVAIRVTLEDDRDEALTVRLAVRDTGIGIPRQKQDRLFVPFSQVDESTTRLYGGTGLGLAISKQLAELMGGSIGVESVEHEGSTFWFTARLGKRSVSSVRPPTSPITAPRPAEVAAEDRWRVLLVEDNPEIRRWH